MSQQRLLVGKIATAHGVRGLLKINVFADDPYLLDGTLYTAATGDRTVNLKMKNSAGKFWLAEAEGVADRTAAEKLRGTELWVERGALPVLESEGQHYISDLIGLPVCDETGKEIGRLIAVENFGAGDLLEIQPSLGESFYLPFTAENVKAINQDGITAVIPEGLI